MEKAIHCPCCGAPYNPSKYICEHCGSFVLMSNEKQINVPQNIIDNFTTLSNQKEQLGEKYPGIYVFGTLLGKGEIPIRLGAANYYTSAFFNVGGKILLTKDNLYFSSHTFIQSKHELCISLNDITTVSFDKSNLGISDQISIYAYGKRNKFVVYGGHAWVDMILTAKSNLNKNTLKNTQTNQISYTQELVELKKLLDAGIITAEEFAIKKRQLLGF